MSGRSCELCGGPLIRRDNEAPGRFAQRRFCSRPCACAVNGLLGAAATSVPLEQRFWEKVDRRGPDECWPWLASLRNGYGQIGRTAEGRVDYAHRIAYELTVGPIPEGLHIDHLCRNRACVNPAHLEPVPVAENLRRGAGFGQSLYQPKPPRAFCRRGHPMSGDNLYVAPGNGKRACKACLRLNQQARAKRTPS